MKIGLDVDGVLCNFPAGVIDRAKELGLSEHFPVCCHDTPNWDMSEKFSEVMKEAWKSAEFWLKLKPLAYSLPLDFTPNCYITSRPIENWVTEQWLFIWRFPKAPVITVSDPKQKIFHVLERELDLFIDDKYDTVEQLIEKGVNAVLYAAPYQRGHNVSHLPRINSLSEVKNYVRKELSANR